ncbi:unnamed protein product [Effrenium voratum]|uniref:DNA-directed DNA polymerase n=1 Tax=Effrenium voratum TaxID=2562239 RepID=A0AA36IT45_9DINO|nr:unnamed protein product [Effrenium voratum]
MAVLFDSPTSSALRRETLQTYKSSRRCPVDLQLQMPKAQQACDAMGYSWKCSPDHEADDLIATLTWAHHEQRSVKIASADKDLLQLVNDRVSLITCADDGCKNIDASEVMRKWGVRPDQMGYLLALMGDSADEIPGVPGIGRIRGALLLEHYDSLEGILDAAMKGPLAGITPRLQKSLVEHGPRALELYEKVVRLKEVPQTELEIRLAPRNEKWRREVARFCDREDFFQLKQRLCSDPSSMETSDTGGTLEVSTLAEAKRVINMFQSCPIIAVSVEFRRGRKFLAIYGGPNIDLGNGETKAFVDLHGKGTSFLAAWWQFFASPVKKVYHCFADFRRLMESVNSGFDGQLATGFLADVMHMARLWDPSLDENCKQNDVYSVAGLARQLELLGASWRLEPMIKAGEDSNDKWIQCCGDKAAAIFHLHQKLVQLLKQQPWEAVEQPGSTMLEFYQQHWRPLGKLLSDMEFRGMPLDEARLAELVADTQVNQDKLESAFLDAASARLGVALDSLEGLNLNSPLQLRHLFFAAEEKDFESLPVETPLPAWVPLDAKELQSLKKPELEELCREKQCKLSGRKADLIMRLSQPEDPRKVRKVRKTIRIPGMGISPMSATPRGDPQVTLETLQKLLDERASDLGSEGEKAAKALLEWRKIESRLNFLKPLQSAACNGRVHPQLNLNTMTGRLSSRSPNLQGEPVTGDGDVPAVRSILAAPPGRRLLVADYAQLELRLVAHLSDCQPMIEILRSGGDIHSRTAYKMFPEVSQAVDSGSVVLDESEKKQGTLVKEHFPELRKKAKTLNFALLYGKTAFSFGRDWGVPAEEAQAVIDRWFEAFPEVRAWMDQAHEAARRKASGKDRATLRTLLGRRRPLRGPMLHAMRVAGNTPVQGSAADVVLSAMCLIEEAKLKQLGYHMVLQIHDELILEGPEENADEALQELIRIMEDPLPMELRVPLRVDACCVQNWHDAKS